MTDIQSTLDELAKQNDHRTSVFEIEIQELKNSSLTLSGRVLDQSQVDDLHRLFPARHLDTAAIRILNAETHPQARVHVATNHTGLYERPTFGMPLSSELCYGTDLEVLDEQGKWVFTKQTDGYLGWAYRPYLSEGVAPTATHLVVAPSIEMFAEPSEASKVITRLVSGTGVGLEETRGEWVRVKANQTGWVLDFSLQSVSDIPDGIDEKRAWMIQDSQRMIGIPYLWGGTSGNGIDCSGFARLLHRWVGVSIPRDADMQCNAAKPVEPPYEVGDLFFFAEDDSKRNISHVGMSLGGWKMIHSSRGRNGVYVDDIQEVKYLKDIFASSGSFLR